MKNFFCTELQQYYLVCWQKTINQNNQNNQSKDDVFDDYNHGSDMKKNGTGGYPILTGDSNGNFKDFKSNIIQNIW